MACIINSGVLKECAHNFGGLKTIYLANYADIESITYAATGSTNNITAITLASNAELYEFQFVKDTGQVLEELQKNGASSYIQQTLNFQLNGITQAKKEVLNDLSLSTVVAFVKKADNLWRIYGEQKNSAGLEATVLTIDSGTAQNDPAGATITLVGASLDYANVVDDTIIQGLLT